MVNFFPGILNSHVNNFQTRNIRKANRTMVYHKPRKEGARGRVFKGGGGAQGEAGGLLERQKERR